MSGDKRYLRHFDWPLLATGIVLILIGLLNIYSATWGGQGTNFNRQFLWFGIGLAVMMPVIVVDYRILERLSYFIYGGMIASLIAVLVFGRVGSGARRWLDLGPVSMQPSEFAKLAVILALAKYFQTVWRTDGYGAKDLFVPFLLALIPFALIARQPDLGSAGFLLVLSGSLFLILKIKTRLLIGIAALSAPMPFLLWHFYMHDYQKQRVLTMLDPQSDPLGRGYHIIQSIIAIGSGGVAGKGFMQGSQSQLKFLPEQHTDFIFSVLAEEWGFLGGLVTMGLLMAMVYFAFRIAFLAKDRFGQLLATGIGIMFFWQAFINIAMVIGVFPVVGVPLPFISYGGSALLMNMCALGLLLNISMRRFMF